MQVNFVHWPALLNPFSSSWPANGLPDGSILLRSIAEAGDLVIYPTD